MYHKELETNVCHDDDKRNHSEYKYVMHAADRKWFPAHYKQNLEMYEKYMKHIKQK